VIVSSAEEGNISFNFSQYKTLDNTFLFFEEWKDQDAITYHVAQDYFKTFMSKTASLIASKPIMKVYDVNHIEEL
jgi:quinol monooxygenase YgiN